MKVKIILLFLTAICFSCKKSEDRSCFKFVGASKTIEQSLDQLDSLFLHKNIVYELIQSTENKIEITGGENLVHFIEIDEKNGAVTVRNKNKCHFLRSYKKKVKVTIYASNLRYIYSESSENITCGNTLTFPSLTILIREGAGKLNLDIENSTLQVDITSGWGDFELHGSTEYLNLFCRTGSFCDTRDLKVGNTCFVLNRSTGNMYVNADDCALETFIESRGNIYYTGNPIVISETITGEGKLIAL
ncbi:MAG: GIN domain-containing protein [Lishizhenia sp.]